MTGEYTFFFQAFEIPGKTEYRASHKKCQGLIINHSTRTGCSCVKNQPQKTTRKYFLQKIKNKTTKNLSVETITTEIKTKIFSGKKETKLTS